MDKMHSCCGLEADALIAYAYGECEPAESQRVEAHLASCTGCAAEVASLRGLRGALAAWDVPSSPAGIRVVSERDALRQPWWSRVLRPAWGLAAAAGVVLGVALALGGVQMQTVEGGFAVHFGSASQPEGGASPQVVAGAPASTPVATPAGDVLPWRVELARLESELRRDLAPPSADHEVLLEQVRGLITQSERRQQQERALWLTEFAQELDMQRRADRQELQQELGALEGFADYLVRVSQR